MADDDDTLSGGEKALISVATLGAAAIARKGINKAWRVSTGTTPPDPATDDEPNWKLLVLWGAVVGAAVGVARLLAEQQASKAIAARRASGSSS